MKNSLRAASFFTGAGGFDLGFEQAGIEIVFQCEQDKFCNQLLNNKYPNTIKNEDIRELQPESIPYADIYFGGFPCQDASAAGNRAGIAGEKTGLFLEFARLIKANRPQWIVLENVVGLLSSGGRNDFRIVIETLAQCGYYVSWRVLDAKYFGVPQRRRRVFIVGCLGDWRSPFQVLFEPEIKGKIEPKSSKDESEIASDDHECAFGIDTQFLGDNNRKLHYSQIAGTLCASEKGYAICQKGSQLRFTTPLECERLMGFPDNYTAGFSDTQRYKMLGNAVAVPVAKFLGSRIVNLHSCLVSNHFTKGICHAA